jgi:cytochrome b561
MYWLNTSKRYGIAAIGVHWLMLLILVAVYASIEMRTFFPKDSEPRELMKLWHFMLGLSVLALVSIRVVIHMTGPTPVIQPVPPKWQSLLARLMHILLYLFIIGMPLAGWFLLSAEGKPIPFFGLQLPELISQNKNAAEWIKEVHETGGTIGYFIIGLHAAAALYHQYIVRDNTLSLMLPAGADLAVGSSVQND